MCTSLSALVLFLAAPLVAQAVEPSPPIVELGAATRIHVRGAGGEPVAGRLVRVRARALDGAEVVIGPTAADGGVDFEPAVAGRHSAWVTTADDELLAASFDAVEPPLRLWWFAAGLAIAVGVGRPHWRRWRARRGRAAALKP